MRVWKRSRKLGIAEETRRYDLPFSRDTGTDFLMMLVGLMTFLAVLALAASLMLSGMAKRWSSGLENRITIEIPAETMSKELRTPGEIEQMSGKVAAALRDNKNVDSFDILKKEDIEELLEPWLGKTPLTSVPLPGLISVELASDSQETIKSLYNDMAKIGPDITIDTHEAWLQDLLSLISVLKLATVIITFIIGITTVTAVAGGVKSRMAIYKADVELLHLMGANDEYITKQFQRHTLDLALRGALTGTIIALAMIFLFGLMSGESEESVLPAFSLSSFNIAALMLAPLAACGIAAATARLTVLRALSQMP